MRCPPALADGQHPPRRHWQLHHQRIPPCGFAYGSVLHPPHPRTRQGIGGSSAMSTLSEAPQPNHLQVGYPPEADLEVAAVDAECIGGGRVNASSMRLGFPCAAAV